MSDAPTKRQIAAIKRKLDMQIARMSKARDAVRELLSEMEEYAESWTDAVESLEYAANRLSELL